jgi:hypothetical protein
MPKLDQQISTLQDKLGQLKLRQQRLEEKKRAVAAERERKAQTRRQILVGTVVLAKAERGEMDRQALLSWLDEALTRPNDRQLFGLRAGGKRGDAPSDV